MRQLKQFICKQRTKKENRQSNNQSNSEGGYFEKARSWSDDLNAALVVSRQRYKIALYLLMGLSTLLVVCITVLVPLQRTQLVVVHQGDDGYSWVSLAKHNQKAPINWQRTQSEVAQYVIARESYDPVLYPYQTKQVNLLSSPQVQAQYELSQSSSNNNSPIHILGAKGYRTVVVHNVLPLDRISQNQTGQSTHHNLAQVNFVVVDHLFGENQTVTTPYTALISWRYQGVPSNPQAMLHNWDGFQITKYLVQPVNTSHSS